MPPIPPSDPKDWTGWWWPFLAPDAAAVAVVAAFLYVEASPNLFVGLLSPVLATALVVLLPMSPVGVLVGIGVAALATDLDAYTSRELWRGVFSAETRSAALHHELDQLLRVPLAGCAASLVVGVLTGRCPRSVRDVSRRIRFDRRQRQRIARGEPPLYVPGDALWGVRYASVPLERPDEPAPPVRDPGAPR